MPRVATNRKKSRRAGSSSPPSGGASWFPVALFGLLAVGCVADYSCKQLPKKKPRYLSFQVDPSSDLWAPAKRAAEEWSAALGRPITVTPDGEVPIFRIADDVCAPGRPIAPGMMRLGCAMQAGTPDQHIEITSTTRAEDLLRTLRHEMGHILHGDDEHLEAPNTVMEAASTTTVITPADVAWICQKFDCGSSVLSPAPQSTPPPSS